MDDRSPTKEDDQPSKTSATPPKQEPTEPAHENVKEEEDALFECNICLDTASQPVITFCGHLYCWPCIYQWLNQNGRGLGPRACPVCKSTIDKDKLVPIYTRGK